MKFAVSVLATQTKIDIKGYRTTSYHNVYIMRAVSEDEVVGKAYNTLKQEKPDKAGWGNYDVVVLEIT